MLPKSNSTDTKANADSLGIYSIKKFILQLNSRLEKLALILREEKELLASGSPDQISEIAQSKLSKMQELTQFISNYFNEDAVLFENEFKNLEDLIKLIDQTCIENKIIEWNMVKELLSTCHNLSEENSILLANRLKYTNNAIDTLFSLAGTVQNKTYDMRGLSQPNRISKQLASA